MKITSIKAQVKRSDRYSVFVDGEYAFSLSESGLLGSGLASGQKLDAKELATLKKAAGEDKAYGQALRYVAMRPRSEWEVTTYLERKDVDAAMSQAIIKRLINVKLLDDATFARIWVDNRRLLKNISKRLLRLELRQKHVESTIIDQVLAEDQTDDLSTLRQLIDKKRARYPDQQKLISYLARQGFNYDDIKTALQDNL